LLNTLPYAGYQFGDILEVKARLTEPGSFKGFDYQSYLAKEDIYSVCYYPLIKVLEKTTNQGFFNALFSLRSRIENLIKQSFTEPQGSFLSAILLGIKDQIPDQVRFWFAQSGIAHVLAISGLHITILAQILLIFFVNVFLISREKAFWPTAIIIILFVLLTGASASSIRAAIMGLGLVWSYRIGRPQAGKRIKRKGFVKHLTLCWLSIW